LADGIHDAVGAGLMTNAEILAGRLVSKVLAHQMLAADGTEYSVTFRQHLFEGTRATEVTIMVNTMADVATRKHHRVTRLFCAEELHSWLGDIEARASEEADLLLFAVNRAVRK
jgi:hypothetical protein